MVITWPPPSNKEVIKMIKPWVKQIHNALHGDGKKKKNHYVIIKGKRHYIRCTSQKEIPYIEVGKFTFIRQNPKTYSIWAQKARGGKNVTQVLIKEKYYGVIVGKEIFKYGNRKEEIALVGYI